MIVVFIPASYEAERRYAIDVLLGDFLGLPVLCEIDQGLIGEVVISVAGGGSLSVVDGLFALPPELWLTGAAEPNSPSVLRQEDEPNGVLAAAGIDSLPMIGWGAGRPEKLFCVDGNRPFLNLDVFGVAFYMLTRYEEFIVSEADTHGRFPASASYAVRHGLLGRPVVNEYLEVLWVALSAVVPRLERRSREFRHLLSHDVDIPFDLLFKSGSRFAKSLVGDVVTRREPKLAIQRVLLRQKVRDGDWAADPYNTFEWIWRQSEKRGLQSAFYFMAGRADSARDGDYEIEHPAVRALIRRSAERGHEIGLHPSYTSCCNPEVIQGEFFRLKRVCEEEGVVQQRWGGRHHYLRWSVRETARHWEHAGLAYDSTLGFAARIGFRCGTCYEYPLFDLIERRALNLKERPLLVMEATLLSREYMGLRNLEDALAQVAEIKRVCRRFSGDFTLLWHNNNLTTPSLKHLYAGCLDL